MREFSVLGDLLH